MLEIWTDDGLVATIDGQSVMIAGEDLSLMAVELIDRVSIKR
jgi:hypothetical protein